MGNAMGQQRNRTAPPPGGQGPGGDTRYELGRMGGDMRPMAGAPADPQQLINRSLGGGGGGITDMIKAVNARNATPAAPAAPMGGSPQGPPSWLNQMSGPGGNMMRPAENFERGGSDAYLQRLMQMFAPPPTPAPWPGGAYGGMLSLPGGGFGFAQPYTAPGYPGGGFGGGLDNFARQFASMSSPQQQQFGGMSMANALQSLYPGGAPGMSTMEARYPQFGGGGFDPAAMARAAALQSMFGGGGGFGRY